MGFGSVDETPQTAEKLSWVGGWGLDAGGGGGFMPLIGGRFHADISDDAAAWGTQKDRKRGARKGNGEKGGEHEGVKMKSTDKERQADRRGEGELG